MVIPSARAWTNLVVPWVRGRWSRHGRTLLWLGAAYMAVAAFFRLRYAFLSLTSLPEQSVDLAYRYAEVQRWFAGLPVYGHLESADYPPASYALLWPFTGWMPIEVARWIWAVTAGMALAALAWLVVRETGARARPERLFVALLPFPMYATQLTVWLGQLGLHALVAFLAGLVWLHRGRGRWWEDLGAALLLLLGLIKPTLTVPLLWIVCFAFGRLRPIAFVGLGYAGLTLLASSYQEASLHATLGAWLGQGSMLTLHRGTVNVHRWLDLAGWEAWSLPASALVLFAFGVWTYRHRKADLWVLIGVGALVARLWIHHRSYDDLLLLVPMIPLFRLARRRATGDRDVVAGVSLAAVWAASLFPYWAFVGELSDLIRWAVEAGQTAVWLAVLAFLLIQARSAGGRRPASVSP